MDSASNVTLLSTEMVLSCLHYSEDAVKRCILLSNKVDVARNLGKLFRVLLDIVGERYVERRLDGALNIMPMACFGSYSKTIELVEKYIRMVHCVNQIVILIQKHYHVDILPNISISANDMSYCERIKNSLLSRLEAKVELGLEKSLSSLGSAMELILTTQQKKADYFFKDDSRSSYNHKITKGCSEAIAFAKKIKELFEKNLDGNNLKNVLEELGNRFYRVLLDHLKKFKATYPLNTAANKKYF
jgi:hypothetical protein